MLHSSATDSSTSQPDDTQHGYRVLYDLVFHRLELVPFQHRDARLETRQTRCLLRHRSATAWIRPEVWSRRALRCESPVSYTLVFLLLVRVCGCLCAASSSWWRSSLLHLLELADVTAVEQAVGQKIVGYCGVLVKEPDPTHPSPAACDVRFHWFVRLS